MSSVTPKLRVAICGGGISGLCLALSLSRQPHIQVDVYEATQRFKEIGAGVMIWSRTWRILGLMGLESEFSQIAHAPPDGSMGVGFDYRRSDRPQEGFQFKLVDMPYGCIRFHRAAFLDVFADHLPSGIAHFGKRLTSYSQIEPQGPVTLQFADGDTALCDLLVACDGIKSCIRAQMFRDRSKAEQTSELLQYIEPIWTGTIAYRGLIQVENIPKARDGSPHRSIGIPMMYCGKGKHVVCYSISQGNVVNVVTFASDREAHGMQYEGEWVVECSQRELLDCYAGWEDEVEDLLKCIDKPTRWAIHHLRPLPFYVSKRVVLVGDAAHAMAPHQGAGAGQAIEDSFILSGLLADATVQTLDYALEAYQATRLPAGNAVLQESFESGLMYEFESDFGEDYEHLGPAIQAQWNWISATTPEDDLARALKIFRNKRRDIPSNS